MRGPVRTIGAPLAGEEPTPLDRASALYAPAPGDACVVGGSRLVTPGMAEMNAAFWGEKRRR